MRPNILACRTNSFHLECVFCASLYQASALLPPMPTVVASTWHAGVELPWTDLLGAMFETTYLLTVVLKPFPPRPLSIPYAVLVRVSVIAPRMSHVKTLLLSKAHKLHIFFPRASITISQFLDKPCPTCNSATSTVVFNDVFRRQ